jgi:hypothetical protein
MTDAEEENGMIADAAVPMWSSGIHIHGEACHLYRGSDAALLVVKVATVPRWLRVSNGAVGPTSMVMINRDEIAKREGGNNVQGQDRYVCLHRRRRVCNVWPGNDRGKSAQQV